MQTAIHLKVAKARKVYLNGELIQEANINWSSTGGGTGGMILVVAG